MADLMSDGWQFVRIYCEAERHRRPGEAGPVRRSEVRSLYRDRPDSCWKEVELRSARQRADIAAAGQQGVDGATLLDFADLLRRMPPKADRPEAYQGVRSGVPPDADQDGFPVLRGRWAFECRLCGRRSRLVVRDEKLQAVLDQLAAAGVFEIALGGLATRL
jgi:hypothetical protein